MVSQELELIGEYASKQFLNYDEANNLQFLIIKWMLEQGMLG